MRRKARQEKLKPRLALALNKKELAPWFPLRPLRTLRDKILPFGLLLPKNKKG
jgi:hypothetical protein